MSKATGPEFKRHGLACNVRQRALSTIKRTRAIASAYSASAAAAALFATLALLLHSSLPPPAQRSISWPHSPEGGAFAMAATMSNNDWTVHQFFNSPYESVSAAYWSEPQPTPQREEQQQPPVRQPKVTTVEIKCLMCCEGCKKNVKKALSNMTGIRSFKVNTETHKVTVTGESLRPEDVLSVVRKASKKQTELWPERRQPQPERKLALSRPSVAGE